MAEQQLLLIRHGEAAHQLEDDVVVGRSDESALTEKGIEQAADIGLLLAERGHFPDVVFVSTQKRARQTASFLLAAMNLDYEPVVVLTPRLQEMSQGVWEGQPRSELYTQETVDRIKQEQMDFAVEGGESAHDVSKRMYDFLMDDVSRAMYRSGKRTDTLFAVTHQGAARALIARMQGLTHSEMLQQSIPNAGVRIMTNGDDGRWSVAPGVIESQAP